MTQIRVHQSEDGYLFGCVLAAPENASNRYWHPSGSEDCQPCTLSVWEIPEYDGQSGIVDTLLAHGTSDQVHKDGYEAQNYLNIIGKPVS